jgi:hypothetical protein
VPFCDASFGCDSPSVAMYKQVDVFDAVSQATPPAGSPAQMAWQIPVGLPSGDYVLWVEVAKAFDFNASFNSSNYPAPTGISYADYGQPYRGQPSILYKVPFTIGTADTMSATQSYAGFGDPDGGSAMSSPDPTQITENMPGSGAQRLQLISGTNDRVQVVAKIEHDTVPPAPISDAQARDVTGTTVTLRFTAPGDDGTLGTVAGYDIRYRTLDAITAANFDDVRTTKVLSNAAPAVSGTLQTITLHNLLPETDYWIGIRAYDDCRNTSDLAVVQVTTGKLQGGYVDACFVATAAYGSVLAGDVETLRRFRDYYLKSNVLGELAVETYYTFGPPVAGVVGESEVLRALARDVLAPLIARVRSLGV